MSLMLISSVFPLPTAFWSRLPPSPLVAENASGCRRNGEAGVSGHWVDRILTLGYRDKKAQSSPSQQARIAPAQVWHRCQMPGGDGRSDLGKPSVVVENFL